MKTVFIEQVTKKEKNILYANLLKMIEELSLSGVKVKSFEDGILIGTYKRVLRNYTDIPLSVIFKFIEDDKNIMEQMDHVVSNIGRKKLNKK